MACPVHTEFSHRSHFSANHLGKLSKTRVIYANNVGNMEYPKFQEHPAQPLNFKQINISGPATECDYSNYRHHTSGSTTSVIGCGSPRSRMRWSIGRWVGVPR